MAERTRERTRDEGEAEPTVDALATERTGLRSRLRTGAGGLFSVRGFLLSLVAAVVGSVVVGSVLPLGGVAGLLGIALAGFGLGAGLDARRYLEVALAGAIAAGAGALLDFLVLSLLGLGLPLVAFGAGSGAVAGVLGHYFGRDLRAGLTRDL